jgi:hypothetical protein
MVPKLRLVILGVMAVAMLAAVTAGSASAAAKPKPELILKEKGKAIPNGTQVKGGWSVGIETIEEVSPDVSEFLACESEGAMKLVTNSSTKADVAEGAVNKPDEECGEFELEFEPEAGPALLRHLRGARHVRRHHHGRHARTTAKTATTPVTPIPLEGATFTAGTMSKEEMTVKKTGTLDLSTPLKVTGEEAGKKCTYESKTKYKGVWPAEEYPGTADVEVEFEYKLAKGSTKGCVKVEEGYIEAWLGPDYEELEAELT